MLDFIFYLRWVFLILFLNLFILFIYFLYRYYIRNGLAQDVWNFFSKSNTFNKVVNDLVFKGNNSYQREVIFLKVAFWLVGIFLCLTIWSIGYYEEKFM